MELVPSLALSIHDLYKSYVAGSGRCRAAVRALYAVSITVQAGEVVEIIGPRGSGKTTLLLCAAGLLRPDSGSVRHGRSNQGPIPAHYVQSLHHWPPHLPLRTAGPRLLLVDAQECAGGCTPAHAVDTVIRFVRASGAAVLLASRARTSRLATRIVVLHAGLIVRDVSRCPRIAVEARVAEAQPREAGYAGPRR